MNSTGAFLSADEQGLLQEIMNIAFGKAVADLAEVVDIFVVLSVPEVKIIPGSELPATVTASLEGHTLISIVRQTFYGEFSGKGLLALPSEASRELVALLGNSDLEGHPNLPLRVLEMESLLEVGNILIGACVGKLAELLDDAVVYSPPQVLQEKTLAELSSGELCAPEAAVIVLKTLFRFSGRNVAGYLFLVTDQASIQWLRKALADFLGRYA